MLLVADAHLSAAAPARSRLFFDFLSRIAGKAQALFVLGDLFDVWLGDDDESPLAKKTKAALAELTAAGVPVFIQRGNRDFLLGARFMRATGCSLLPDEYALQCAGRRWLLAHGDAYVDDPAYRRYRRWLRPGLSLAAAATSLPRRRRLAAALRANSRGGRRRAALDARLVAAAMRRHHCDRMAHGHLHERGEAAWEDGDGRYRRFSLPDWQTAPGYATINNGRLVFAEL